MKKSTRKMIDLTAMWLLVVGGLNWALGIIDFNLVQSIAGWTVPVVGTIIYAGIGIASLYIGGRVVMGKLFK